MAVPAWQRQTGSHRQPLFFSQMIFSPPAATPVMPASACGQKSPGLKQWPDAAIGWQPAVVGAGAGV